MWSWTRYQQTILQCHSTEFAQILNKVYLTLLLIVDKPSLKPGELQWDLPYADTLRSRKNVRLRKVSAYGKLKLHRLYVAGTMTKCLFRRGVRLWKPKTAAFVCCWDHD